MNEIIVNAMKYLEDKVRATIDPMNFMDDEGNCYVAHNGKLLPVNAPYFTQDKLQVSTLKSVVDYINEQVDDSYEGDYLVKVDDTSSVSVFHQLDERMNRVCVLNSKAIVPGFNFDQWIGYEDFIINVQSKFLPNDDSQYLLSLVSKIKVEEGVDVTDDGMSQVVKARNGVSLVGNEVVKNRLNLVPVRTFIEVPQPSAEFVFRIRERGGSIQCALFASDGDIWKITANESIVDYLTKNIVETKNSVKILS